MASSASRRARGALCSSSSPMRNMYRVSPETLPTTSMPASAPVIHRVARLYAAPAVAYHNTPPAAAIFALFSRFCAFFAEPVPLFCLTKACGCGILFVAKINSGEAKKRAPKVYAAVAAISQAKGRSGVFSASRFRAAFFFGKNEKGMTFDSVIKAIDDFVWGIRSSSSSSAWAST